MRIRELHNISASIHMLADHIGLNKCFINEFNNKYNQLIEQIHHDFEVKNKCKNGRSNSSKNISLSIERKVRLLKQWVMHNLEFKVKSRR
ncbi:MAG: hypothetical protein FJZ43_00035 [Candidatus Staskawiczbacteria bacterium]|nr:hypothetical protein [Candidatus Staskawiczbacteria bacterium]